VLMQTIKNLYKHVTGLWLLRNRAIDGC
jgi:hypothetical protein